MVHFVETLGDLITYSALLSGPHSLYFAMLNLHYMVQMK